MQTNYWIELPTNYAMEQMTNEIQLNKKKAETGFSVLMFTINR